MYDPATSRDWKRTVTAQVLEVRPATPVDGPLTLWLRFYLPRPRTLPKKVRHHTKRPDLDNIVKAVKDALRGIVYRDDAQIIELLARKQYGVPGVDILVERVLHEAAAEVTNLESLGGGRGEWRD
jgi:Holliday junction resolvase RusA-like endonuclease